MRAAQSKTSKMLATLGPRRTNRRIPARCSENALRKDKRAMSIVPAKLRRKLLSFCISIGSHQLVECILIFLLRLREMSTEIFQRLCETLPVVEISTRQDHPPHTPIEVTIFDDCEKLTGGFILRDRDKLEPGLRSPPGVPGVGVPGVPMAHP
jgi:hypothetical protein